MIRRISLPLLCLLLLLPSGVHAQVQLRGFDISAGWAGWSGEDFEGVEPGSRIQASVFGQTSPRAGFGLTATWGDVGFESDQVGNGGELGLGLTVRYSFADIGESHAFVDGHIGWTRFSATPQGSPEIEGNGLAIGPGVGYAVPIGESTTFILGGDFHYHSYSEFAFVQGIPLDTQDASGWRWALRAGLTYFLFQR